MVPTAVPRLLTENGSLLGGIAQITPNLFLSRGNVASNRSLLLSKGITCVVNATIELPNFNWPHMEYVKVPLADMPHSPISLYFDSVADKIHSVGRKRGAVLVHCAAGVSRSASLCLAYLMKYHRVSLAEAHAWVKARRPVIRPNGGFWRQLIEYERKLFGRNSVKMVQTPYGVIPDVYDRDRRCLAPYWGLLMFILHSYFPQETSSDVKEMFCHSFSFAVATEQQADIDMERYLSCAHTSEGPPKWSPQ
ncbi:dual specificity protein phosphatase 14 isoform X1 [Enoplosus armatus]|uniref:dual specificity protein phosphatase 14 isoform X1 n=1 Tax=Enoplosus armatus TaxID=215367 RepID=UPI003992D9BA